MRNNERLGRMVLAALLWLPLFAPAQADEKPPARTQAEKPAADVDPDAYAKMIQAVWEGSFPQPHEGVSEMEPEMDFFEAAQGLRAKHPELFGEAKGVLVVGWGPFEQGAKAGITSGDVLIRYGDTPLDSGQQLEDLIIRTSKTQRVLVRYLRGDRVREAAVHGGQLGITTRDMDEVLSSSTQASKMLQAARALREKRPELFGEAKGVLVVGWIPAGQAAKAKLALGDILIHYGDTPLHSIGQLVELVGRIPGSQDVRLRYLRGTEVREAAIHGGRIGIEIRDVVKPKSSPDRIADEAEALFLEVSHIRKALPPADHPDIVATLIDLGTSVYNRGRDNEDPNPFDVPVDFKREAAVAFQAAVNIEKDRLPMDHQSVEFNVEAFAVSLQRNGRYDQAATLLLAAVEASKATLPAGHPAIAFYLRALAESYQKAERFAEAEPLLREVLAIQRAALPENDTELAVTLRSLAESLRSSRRYREAEQLYREALAIWRCALPTDDVRIAEALGDLGGLLRDTLRYDEAEPFYREALAIWKAAVSSGKPDLRNWSVAQKLNDLATLLANSGRYAEAEPLFRESLLMLKPIMPPGNIFLRRTIENLGMSLCATGHYAEAEQIYREALAADGGSHHLFNVRSLVSLARLLKTTGRYGEAEQLYREALAIRKESLPADDPDIAESLDGLAEVLEAVGRYNEAEQLLRQGLAARRVALPAGDRVMANSLNSLAGLLKTTGRYDEAERLYREALGIYKATLPPGSPGIATGLNNLGVLLQKAGRFGEAESLYREILVIDKSDFAAGSPTTAYHLNNLGSLLEDTRRYSEAEPLYRKAMQIAQGAGEPQLLWTVANHLSTLYAAQGQNPLAIFFGKQTVNALQDVRQGLADSERATQQGFLKTKESYYKHLSDLLIAQGRLAEAQQVLEMLKKAEYFEQFRGAEEEQGRELRASYNTFEQEQADRLAQAAAPLAKIGAELNPLQPILPAGRTPEQTARIEALSADLTRAQDVYAATLTQVKEAFAGLDAAQQANLNARLKLLTDYRTLIGGLGRGVVLVQYLVLDDQVRILLTTRDSIRAFAVPVKAADLNREVFDLYTALRRPEGDPRTQAKALYDRLIAPIAAALDVADTRTLMVDLDGTLRYLPLAALYDGQRWLVERYDLGVYTALGKKLIAQAPGRHWQAGGLGNSQGGDGFGPLPAVAQELNGIVKETRKGRGVLPGKVYLNGNFTRDTLTRELHAHRQVIHIASHFAFNPGSARDSFLLLGDGSRLSLDELRQDRYRFDGVDLVTLSACETALDGPGSARASGKEVEGLGSLVQRHGAKGVMASLWPVADTSTAWLMQRFYHLRETHHLSKAAALRRAQTELMHTSAAQVAAAMQERRPVDLNEHPAAEDTPAPSADYSRPYYWAPFVLMGNWL